MDAREIGRAVKSLLMQDSEASGLIGGNIFPFPAVEGAKFPVVTYTVEEITPSYTKDRNDFQDTVVLQLDIWSESYEGKIAIANACHKALQGKRGNIEGFEVTGIRRVNESEVFVEGTYGQSIIYNIDLENI